MGWAPHPPQSKGRPSGNPQLYSIYFDGDAEYHKYLARMARDKEWGDEMTLKAFCDYFGVVVHLVLLGGRIPTAWPATLAILPGAVPEYAETSRRIGGEC